jgi:aspartyl aminopeptidase
MEISAHSRELARDLLNFIDASPSPWHAVQTAADRLLQARFVALREDERWQLAAGGRYFVIRGGASIVAFVIGSDNLEARGFRLVGAHTDSPGLRVKPKALQAGDGLLRVGVEVYGGPLLATFADRDLSLAGRVAVRQGDGITMRLVHFAEPLLRLPNLAIHMNREVNENGLKFNKQTELPLLLGVGGDGGPDDGRFHSLLATRLAVAPDAVLSWELAVCDTQPGAFWGMEGEFVADGQIDNLASCHAGLTALLGAASPSATNVCAFFDHEEVGSESAAGAGGSFIADVLRRIAASAGLDDEGLRCALARSFFISADMAHAYHRTSRRPTSRRIGLRSTAARCSRPTPTSATAPGPRAPPASSGCARRLAFPGSNMPIAAISAAAAPSARSSPRASGWPASMSVRRCGRCTASARVPGLSITAA